MPSGQQETETSNSQNRCKYFCAFLLAAITAALMVANIYMVCLPFLGTLSLVIACAIAFAVLTSLLYVYFFRRDLIKETGTLEEKEKYKKLTAKIARWSVILFSIVLAILSYTALPIALLVSFPILSLGIAIVVFSIYVGLNLLIQKLNKEEKENSLEKTFTEAVIKEQSIAFWGCVISGVLGIGFAILFWYVAPVFSVLGIAFLVSLGVSWSYCIYSLASYFYKSWSEEPKFDLQVTQSTESQQNTTDPLIKSPQNTTSSLTLPVAQKKEQPKISVSRWATFCGYVVAFCSNVPVGVGLGAILYLSSIASGATLVTALIASIPAAGMIVIIFTMLSSKNVKEATSAFAFLAKNLVFILAMLGLVVNPICGMIFALKWIILPVVVTFVLSKVVKTCIVDKQQQEEVKNGKGYIKNNVPLLGKVQQNENRQNQDIAHENNKIDNTKNTI